LGNTDTGGFRRHQSLFSFNLAERPEPSAGKRMRANQLIDAIERKETKCFASDGEPMNEKHNYSTATNPATPVFGNAVRRGRGFVDWKRWAA
jgi:hypothetical protein